MTSIDRLIKHLPSKYGESEGSHITIAGKPCLVFVDCPTKWEVDSGDKGSFTFPYALVVIANDAPLALIRLERPHSGEYNALCMITQDGRHRLIDELSASVSRDDFIEAATHLILEHSAFMPEST